MVVDVNVIVDDKPIFFVNRRPRPNSGAAVQKARPAEAARQMVLMTCRRVCPLNRRLMSPPVSPGAYLGEVEVDFGVWGVKFHRVYVMLINSI